jgi:cysteine desulfurase / selenocysteine lyase
MPDMKDEFGPFDGRIWLNAAHQGPLPRSAVRAAEGAIADKVSPHRIEDADFQRVPQALKSALAATVGVDPLEIILGNSTTYGLHLLAHGLEWRPGDEIVVVRGEFPATIVPWLWLEEEGVTIREITPRRRPLSAEDLAGQLTSKSRLFCSSWVFSFSGEVIDVESLAAVCRSRGVLFVLNGSQGVGARVIDAAAAGIDAVTSCGFKWLCGPYGTGFCWIRPHVLEQLRYRQDYWLTQIDQTDLSAEPDLHVRGDLSARRYDVFCTANFFNFVPWTAAVETLLTFGVGRAQRHNDSLVAQLIDQIDQHPRLRIVSPTSPGERSALVHLTHADASRNRELHDHLRRNGVDAALRANLIRFSPHVYNDAAEIEHVTSSLLRIA